MLTTTITHTLTASGPRPATEAGDLDGYFARCACGFTVTHSLGERFAVSDLHGHARYMNARR